MTNKETFEKFEEAIRQAATYWDITELPPIMKAERNQNLISGVMFAALYVLPGDDYQKLVMLCHELGFNH